MTTLTKSISLDADSKSARFYLWVYDANPDRINTCKLFWAYFFSPLVIFLRFTVGSAVLLAAKIWDRRDKKPKKAKPEVSRAESALDTTSSAISGWYARWQRFFRWAGIVLGVVWALTILALLTLAVISNPVAALSATGIIVGFCLLVVGLVVVVDSGPARGFWQLLKDLGNSVHTHTCAKVELKEKSDA